MEINSIYQAESAFAKLSEMAEVCRQLGIVTSVSTNRDITSDICFRYKVAVNEYLSNQHKWEASQNLYGDDKEAHYNGQAASEMEDWMKEQIAAIRADIQAKADILGNHSSILK